MDFHQYGFKHKLQEYPFVDCLGLFVMVFRIVATTCGVWMVHCLTYCLSGTEPMIRGDREQSKCWNPEKGHCKKVWGAELRKGKMLASRCHEQLIIWRVGYL
jgi:hypothetical protein